MTAKKVFLIAGIVVLCLVTLMTLLVMKYVILIPEMYASHPMLTDTENREIKSVVLHHVREAYVSEGNAVCVCDSDFMQTVVKEEDDTYRVRVCTSWPNDWTFYITIKRDEQQFPLIDCEIDP